MVPAEAHAEGPGHRGFRMARVRTRVCRMIAPPDADGSRGALADTGGRDRDCQRGEPRRNEVRDIVQSRRGPAEVGVGRLAMTDHRVQRVHRLVGHGGRHAAGDEKAQRGHDAVACAFGKRLDHAASDLGLGECRRIPADDPASVPRAATRSPRSKALTTRRASANKDPVASTVHASRASASQATSG